jgi:hypothetical protein
VTRCRRFPESAVLFVTHSRFFSATRGLAASDEFFLKVEPSSVAKARFPFQLIENLLEMASFEGLVAGPEIRRQEP